MQTAARGTEIVDLTSKDVEKENALYWLIQLDCHVADGGMMNFTALEREGNETHHPGQSWVP